MNDDTTTTATLDQTDEDILTCDVSDEALEAATGREGAGFTCTFGFGFEVATCRARRINSP